MNKKNPQEGLFKKHVTIDWSIQKMIVILKKGVFLKKNVQTG
jgi:hypothetical protein